MISMARFSRAALAGMLLAFGGLTGLAEAQYYPPPGYYAPGPYRDPYYTPRPRRVAMGSVCVTSRGECSVGRYVPIGTGCKCFIPGFGQKRGHVQY